jgi:hypothetical protein
MMGRRGYCAVRDGGAACGVVHRPLLMPLDGRAHNSLGPIAGSDVPRASSWAGDDETHPRAQPMPCPPTAGAKRSPASRGSVSVHTLVAELEPIANLLKLPGYIKTV